ncbi:MAG: peptidoglycan DD-metalloendopeptidase family protein [Ruminococcaceae bacterium]|nr:peptidoglycan DD-metalloendopeptidase family protein [Oscillospiraceae bacterium]
MNKKIIAIFLILIISITMAIPSSMAHAVDPVPEDDPEIIKLRQEIEDLNKEIAANEAKMAEIMNEKKEVKKSADALMDQIAVLQGQIDNYNFKIRKLNSQIAALNTQIMNTENEIKATEEKMEQQEKDIADTQEILGERVRAMYMSGNVSTIEVILEADSFESLLTRLELIARIAAHDNAIIEALKKQIAELASLKAKLEEDKIKLEESKASIEFSKTETQAAKAEVNKAKSVLDAKLFVLDSHVAKLNAEDAAYKRMIARAEAQREAYDQKIYFMIHGIASTGDGSVGNMIWPVPYESSYISSAWGQRDLNAGSGNFHYGMDISMPGANAYDKRIIACATGKVLLASNSCSHNYRGFCGCNGGYGRYVIIDQGQGVYVYYAHLATVYVSEGEIVSQGQNIGIMGCTGNSTGAHLHLEMRIGGIVPRSTYAVNPGLYVRK